jgi:3-phenylpropionate/trans-cinnamate dioxygenase ferredoxin reductase subunit
MQTIAIVGASLAGLRAAQALRKRGFAGRLVMIGAEAHAPYDRPPLSKQLLSGEWPVEKLFFHARESHAALAIEQHFGQAARALRPREREVELDSGETISYDGLVIATGATARTLPQAAGFSGVHVLRTLDDAMAVAASLERSPRVAVIGAGFIGLEVAASCRKRGLSVSVIEPQRSPLLAIVGEQVSRAVEALHVDQGVHFYLGARVRELQGAGRLERIVLEDGREIDADVAVVGIGVMPETRWLEGSGVELSHGVLCDERMATNVPNVVAAGDVARWPNAAVGGDVMLVEHWSNAVEQAAAAAARLLDGESAPPYANLPYFWSDQYDRKFQSAGRIRPDDTVELVQGSLADRSFAVLYVRDGQVCGVLTSNAPSMFLRTRKLLAQSVTAEQARALLA